MNRSVVLIIFCFAFYGVTAQSWAGLTGKTDTSFNTYGAFLSAKKNYPEIRIVEEMHSDAVIEMKALVYCKAAGRDLLLDVFHPATKTKERRTAIIIIHGGGWRSGNRSQHYPLAQRLAGMGYVCFTPEYRLSTEALFPAAVYDLKAAIKWVKIKAGDYNIDTNKIAVLGFSAGGELAAFLGTTNGNSNFEGMDCNLSFSSKINAVVDIDGTLSFVHPESGEGDDSKKISAATNWFGASKKDDPALWEKASPLTYASSTTPPTLFINSSIARMHAGREDYIKALTRYNIYTEVKGFENSPHTFCLFQPWFDPTVKYIDDFLKEIFHT